MLHPTPEDLAAASSPRVLAHIARCADCRAALAAAAKARSAPPLRARRNPSRRVWIAAAAAAWLGAAAVGWLAPVERPARPRTYLHIDFENKGGYILTDGRVRTVELGGRSFTLAEGAQPEGEWSAVSIKLTEPLRIERECILRMRIATNAGYVVASLFPVGRDATFVKLDPDGPDLEEVSAVVRPGEWTLREGDTIDWVTVAAPSSDDTYMLVKAIEFVPVQ